MSRLTRDETAEPVSRDQTLRRERGQGKIHFSCSADHGQDWQSCPVDPYSTIYDDHAYIHTCLSWEGGGGRSLLGPYYSIIVKSVLPQKINTHFVDCELGLADGYCLKCSSVKKRRPRKKN